MAHVRFLPKVVTVCFRIEIGFDCKHNRRRSKLANFWLNIISKINYKTLVVIYHIPYQRWSQESSNYFGNTLNNLSYYYSHAIDSDLLLTFKFFP